jgi:N,N'-diacetyllegionaminate synthase
MKFKEKYLKEGPYPYFVAEIGINHNGQIQLAKRMIDASKDAGADAVKFQKRNFEALLLPGAVVPEPTGYLSKDEHDFPAEDKAFGTWTYPDKRLEFTDNQVLELWEYAKSKKIDFLMSPWEERSVDFLVENKAKAIKIASIDIANYQFCEYVASKKIPTITSTGMSNYNNLQIVWDIFDKADCPLMFLHCTSAYPCPIEDKNLKGIPIMRDMFNIDVGFSGHGVGYEGTLGAVVLGANVIEKHVTMSKKMSGPDQAASLEFDEFNEVVEKSKNMIKALGTGQKRFLGSEKVLHGVLSKRFVTKCAIKAGEKITSDSIRTVVTKAEGGLQPDQYYNILGSHASKDLKINQIVNSGDFKVE